MGNYFMKFTTYEFPCQLCRSTFKRQIEGSLLCPNCRICNQFEHLSYSEKTKLVLAYASFPMYSFMKNKQPPILVIENNFDNNCYGNIKPNIKILSSYDITRKHYRIIKRIIKFLEQLNYLGDNKFKGIYIHSMHSNDILFIHHPQIKEKERIIHIDLDGLEKALEN